VAFAIPVNHHQQHHIGDPSKRIQLAATSIELSVADGNPCRIDEHHANITPPPSANRTPDTGHTAKTATGGVPMARGSEVFIGVFLGVLFCGLG